MREYIHNWKVNWPYEAIYHPNGEIEWDINPIIYDNAEIELNWENTSFVLCYKISKNIFWSEIKYADIINEMTWEIFSFQANNIFMIKIVWDDVRVLAKVWDDLKYYENFWKIEYNIEPDWDKKDLTPLWYYNMYVRFDDDYYYPLIIDSEIHTWIIKRFFDYYWYKSFTDNEWWRHLIMLIEDEKENWYWADNFEIFSEKIYFSDDIEEIETWDITPDWVITMVTSYETHYYLDENGKVIEWRPATNTTAFVFTRYYEDTDIDFIVWKNENWYFIINRVTSELSDKQREKIVYLNWFKAYTNNSWKGYFLMVKPSWEIALFDQVSKELMSTDLEETDIVTKITYDGKLLTVILGSWENRQYI